MVIGKENKALAAVPSGVDGAVGVPGRRWYVAIVSPRHEKSVSEKLTHQGVETYVATQRELHVWKNGRRRQVERVVIPGIVFVRVSESERRAIVAHPFIHRFMVDRCAESRGLNRPAAVIPDVEMQKLQFMLGHAEAPVEFVATSYNVHDSVRVVRGGLMGLTGEIIETGDGRHRLTVSIAMLGGATVHIDPSDVEKI